MIAIPVETILQLVGGVPAGGDRNAFVSQVCIDSREVAPGCLFAALRGERTDGHLYIGAAAAAGAVAVLAEQDAAVPDLPDCCVIRVPSTLKVLHALAAGYKKLFRLRTVGVTGSVGKTSTKEWIYSVLASRYNTLKTEGNYNSETGLPLTVFRIGPEHEAAVLEMGMSRRGEIAALTRIAKPDVAVITNIGFSHMEHLGSQENILRAKLEIERGLPRDGVLVLNGDDPLLWQLRGTRKHKTVYYAIENPQAKFRAEKVSLHAEGASFDAVTPVGRMRAEINVPGRHQVLNAMAAITAGLYNGVPMSDCIGALKNFRNAGMRQNIFVHNDIGIIEDCYNAAPDSMRAAFALLRDRGPQRIAVLSDMMELGDMSEQLHREVGEAAAKSCDWLLAYGAQSRYICEGAIEGGMPPEHVLWFDNRDPVVLQLKKLAKTGDTILFKGSRGMQTELVLRAFLEQ